MSNTYALHTHTHTYFIVQGHYGHAQVHVLLQCVIHIHKWYMYETIPTVNYSYVSQKAKTDLMALTVFD